jgi:hypothetical protein
MPKRITVHMLGTCSTLSKLLWFDAPTAPDTAAQLLSLLVITGVINIFFESPVVIFLNLRPITTP